MTDGARRFSAVLRCRPRRSLLLWLLALFVVVSTLPYPQPTHTQDTQNSSALSDSLRGAVINSVTREPIDRALVSSADNRFPDFRSPYLYLYRLGWRPQAGTCAH